VHARVATFEGGDADEVRQTIGEIRGRAGEGPPEGVPAVGFLLLHDADNGKVLAISLFETEEDLRKGDEALNAMDPPRPDGMGKRGAVETYEVGVKVDL
jgi:hypothetical protein